MNTSMRNLLLLVLVVVLLVFLVSWLRGSAAYAQEVVVNPSTVPVVVEPVHRSWRDPSDVQWFLLWLLGPTGIVVSVISIIIAMRTGGNIQNQVQPQLTRLAQATGEAKGSADAAQHAAGRLAETNERQQRNLDNLNRASDPGGPGKVQT